MKRYILLALLPMLAGCASITGDQWRWMDDPALQHWVDIEAHFADRTIRFKVPARGDGFSTRARSGVSLFEGDGPVQIEVPVKTVYQATGVATFHWDHWWAGFGKGSGADFVLTSVVGYYGEDIDRSLLDLTPAEFISWRKKYWEEKFSNSSSWARTRFFSAYKAATYRSGNSLTWVSENWPLRTEQPKDFLIPVGDEHVLHFDFYIDEKSRSGLEPDPAWVERRWEMAYRILDTVEITPREGQHAPARQFD